MAVGAQVAGFFNFETNMAVGRPDNGVEFVSRVGVDLEVSESCSGWNQLVQVLYYCRVCGVVSINLC